VSVGRSVDAAVGAQHAAPVDDPYRLQRFVFPQVAGLGTSGMSRTYAVSGLAEELRSSMTLLAGRTRGAGIRRGDRPVVRRRSGRGHDQPPLTHRARGGTLSGPARSSAHVGAGVRLSAPPAWRNW